MAHSQVTRETRPPQIQIAVRHPQILVLRLGVDWERQRVGAIQNLQAIWNDLDIPRGEVRIFRSRQPRSDTA